ncbi:hypothetical protein CUMW_077920 [Citrus unshiu]|nr:hypothetical protein CUMW_077920 [Citrus unshiu]
MGSEKRGFFMTESGKSFTKIAHNRLCLASCNPNQTTKTILAYFECSPRCTAPYHRRDLTVSSPLSLRDIQTNPSDRPSMHKVLEVFEGSIENLKILRQEDQPNSLLLHHSQQSLHRRSPPCLSE